MDLHDPRVYIDGDTGSHCYRDEDNVVFEWDDVRGGWFPVLTEAVLEQQQSAYHDPESASSSQSVLPPSLKRKLLQSEREKAKASKPKVEPVRKTANTSIYVTGLPLDATATEVHDVFSKYGIIMEDIATGQPKVKLYTKDDGTPKGDALVTYFREESVPIAIQMMDDALFRYSEVNRIHVSKAEFKEKPKEQNGNKSKAAKAAVHKKLKNIEKSEPFSSIRRAKDLTTCATFRKLDWFEPTVSAEKQARNARIVVLKHMFTLDELDRDPGAILDIKADVREECERVGEVTNIILYDKEPEGVITVRFKDELSAAACIQLMNGRGFGGQVVIAELFDGRSKYQRSDRGQGSIAADGDADEEERKRLAAYEEWLEGADAKERTEQ
ncbi:hypothetical protein RI367_006821 [Sorochytrium milnesiophthora]